MTPPGDPAPSPGFLAAFRRAAQSGRTAAGAAPSATAGDLTITFEGFMRLALYGEDVGYYRRARTRVGTAPGTDFFTAGTSGPIFGELIAAACASLLGPAAARTSFVEIGAEFGTGGVLEGVSHGFQSARAVGLGEPLDLGGRCVVFSNELFDAQPCRRFIFRRGGWRERNVTLDRTGRLRETDGAPPDADLAARLPEAAPEGWVVDAPCAAVALLEEIAAQPWTGLLVACDYGKSWSELSQACPEGTLRAYHRHRQSNDLLARPGEQDLTCHVCWDWLETALQSHRFEPPVLESQESFLIHHAGPAIASILESEGPKFSSRKLSLMQLLHPSNLGQKFQVLHAQRRPAPIP